MDDKMQRDPFKSARLVYRAVESPEDDDFFVSLETDPIAFLNSNGGLLRPQTRNKLLKIQKFVQEEATLGVVMCLPSPDANSKPIPIGQIHLHVDPRLPQDRNGMIGIGIAKDYRSQGYGSEAISWVLDWAFDTYGLHKVIIAAFEWNYGARKLYERLGFTVEMRGREQFYRMGRYWDDYRFGMLDREWKEIKAKKQGSGKDGSNSKGA